MACNVPLALFSRWNAAGVPFDTVSPLRSGAALGGKFGAVATANPRLAMLGASAAGSRIAGSRIALRPDFPFF
jgi:hypothetical protein